MKKMSLKDQLIIPVYLNEKFEISGPSAIVIPVAIYA